LKRPRPQLDTQCDEDPEERFSNVKRVRTNKNTDMINTSYSLPTHDTLMTMNDLKLEFVHYDPAFAHHLLANEIFLNRIQGTPAGQAILKKLIFQENQMFNYREAKKSLR
jgi:hypothetical protein